MYDPIAYVYEADYHCRHCAEWRFDIDRFGQVTGTDDEGNEIGAIAPWDAAGLRPTQTCGTCESVICMSCGETSDEPDQNCWNCDADWF